MADAAVYRCACHGQLERGACCGSGGYGVVYRARLRCAAVREGGDGPDQRIVEKDVALKYFFATLRVSDFRNELNYLTRLRGVDGVAQIVGGFNNVKGGQGPVLMLDYFPHDDFRTVLKLSAGISTIRAYLRALFKALAGIHANGVIHRDVKPQNFLFDLRTGAGILVDLGLAQDAPKPRPPAAEPPPVEDVGLVAPPPAKRARLSPRTGEKRAHLAPQHAVNAVSALPDTAAATRSSARGAKMQAVAMGGGKVVQQPRSQPPPHAKLQAAAASKAGGAPRKGAAPRKQGEKVIRKGGAQPNRAGTKGFRAPEVLLRVERQTTAIDVWAAGVIALALISGDSPFFGGGRNDGDALLELALVFGVDKIKELALQHRRLVEIGGLRQGSTPPPPPLREVLRRKWIKRGPNTPSVDDLPDSLFDLVGRCLDLRASERITAEDALRHPFLAEEPREELPEEHSGR